MWVVQLNARRILKKYKFHPYNIRLVHELNEYEFDSRMQVCEMMNEQAIGNSHFLVNMTKGCNWVIFSVTRLKSFRFYLWRYIKEEMYRSPPDLLKYLRARFINVRAYREETLQVLQNVRQPFDDNLYFCIVVGG